ncbi:MAG: bifunctional hydroxymethylpyrimidine kinase/phosphomethylpyrimidine kinase [Pseudomonadota bacterium]
MNRAPSQRKRHSSTFSSSGGKLALVVDPVMVATSGDPLLAPDAEAALKQVIIPRAHVLTPNLNEALRLVGRSAPPQTLCELIDLAREVGDLGAASVLLKGGHVTGTFDDDLTAVTDAADVAVDTITPSPEAVPVDGLAIDLLVSGGTLRAITGPRYRTRHTHGTGCTLSAAIVAALCAGHALPTACIIARQFVSDGIALGARMRVGHGNGPLDHAGAGRAMAALSGV